MKRPIKYADEPMDFAIVADNLPSPEEIARRLNKVKVTVEVDAPTVEAFRKKAGRGRVAYRRMMGRLLDVYAMRKLSAGRRS